MAGFQKIPSEFVRRTGGGLQEMILRRTESVMMQVQNVLLARDADTIIAWGSQIQLLASFVRVYILTDDELENEIRKCTDKVDNIYYGKGKNSNEGRKKIYDAYAHLYYIVAKKLKKFNLYPPLSVGYIQSVGEITEE